VAPRIAAAKRSAVCFNAFGQKPIPFNPTKSEGVLGKASAALDCRLHLHPSETKCKKRTRLPPCSEHTLLCPEAKALLRMTSRRGSYGGTTQSSFRGRPCAHPGAAFCNTNHWRLLVLLLAACVAHHRHELLEVDETITVAIKFLHHLGNGLCTGDVLDIPIVQYRMQLLLRNLTIAVPVE